MTIGEMTLDQLYSQVTDGFALSSSLLIIGIALWMIVIYLYKKDPLGKHK